MITPHGRREILLLAVVLALVAGGLSWIWPAVWLAFAIPAALLLAAVALFFRDPSRRVPGQPNVLVSPADGKVVEIADVDEPNHIRGPAKKLAIFMSLLDVHVNRTPCEGRIERVDHRPGEFLNAARAEATAQNEANIIAIRNTEVDKPVLLMQIAGLVARRVVCASRPGDILGRGERVGVVKFGSRAEVYVPDEEGFAWRAKLGDKVKAGSTIIGGWS